MRLKPLEILASATAAVAAAVVASVFGVKGTLVGAAIGSAVATTVATLVSQSATRAQEAMKRSGLASITGLTRRPAATSAVGDVEASEHANSSSVPGAAETVREAEAADKGPPRSGSARRWRLSIVAVASALGVFVLALGAVTLIEVAAGRSLSSVFGGPNAGSTVGGVIDGVAPTTTTTSTSTSTTTTSTSTSTTTTSPSTASTAAAGSTSGTPSSTTTTGIGITVP